MAANPVVFVHDPYDVFLAVGFGFCYGSALVPAIRMLEKYRHGNKPIETSPTAVQTNEPLPRYLVAAIIFRGILTVIGLACLYGWYSLYLKHLYSDQLPAYRQILDWVSLGLFAIGANCWDNEDHHEGLYCLMQGLATLSFGLTCYLALQIAPKSSAIPLVKAIYWSVIIIGTYIYIVILSWILAKVFAKKQASERKKFSIGLLVVVSFSVALGLLIFLAFQLLGVLHHLPPPWAGIYTAAAIIFAIALTLTVLVETKTIQSRVRSALITLLPMAALIYVTWRNYPILFPHG